MTQFTGTALWDAVGSIGIGCLLGVIATFLVSKNRQLLLGRSMNPKEVEVRVVNKRLAWYTLGSCYVCCCMYSFLFLSFVAVLYITFHWNSYADMPINDATGCPGSPEA